MSVLTTLSAASYSPTAFSQARPDPAFSVGQARAMVWLSQLAYEVADPAKVTALLNAWGLCPFDDGVISAAATSPLPIARAQAILARRSDLAVLAFAGTDPLVAADWVSDFNIAPHDMTTEGFAQALATALPRIKRCLAGLVVPIVVTGHSLGGALAVLAAFALAEAGLPVSSVYTFGMPRPGGTALRGAYDARLGPITYRLVYGNDIVPTVAPSRLGFRHVGRLLRQAPGSPFVADALTTAPGSDEPSFEPALVASVAAHLRSDLTGPATSPAGRIVPSWTGRPEPVRLMIRALPRPIQDHLPDSYIAALPDP